MKKQTINIFIAVSVILVLIPVAFFLLTFWRQSISPNITDWSSFGSFFGGVIGVVISAINVSILVYLTIWVSKQGNEENKNLYLLKKKMDAYDSLAASVHEFVNFTNDMSEITKALTTFNKNITSYKEGDDISTEGLPEAREWIDKLYKKVIIFYNFIFHFNLRYGHIFKYNFSSKEHEELINAVSNFKNSCTNIKDWINSFDNLGTIKSNNFIENFDLLNDKLLIFINKIRDEIS